MFGFFGAGETAAVSVLSSGVAVLSSWGLVAAVAVRAVGVESRAMRGQSSGRDDVLHEDRVVVGTATVRAGNKD